MGRRIELNALLSLLIVIAMVLAGCAGPSPKKACAEAASCSPSAPPPLSPPSGTPAPTDSLPPSALPKGLNETLQFEGCRGGVGSIEVPYDQARENIPQDFLLESLAPETAGIRYEAVRCDRIVMNATVLTDQYFLEVAAFVRPRNDSWNAFGVDIYVLDFRVSSPQLAGFLRGHGLPVEVATFTVTRLPTANLSSLELWEVRNANSSFQFHYRVTGQTGSVDKDTFHYWTGQKPYLRIDYQTRDSAVDLETDGGTMQTEGDTLSHRVIGAAGVYISQAFLGYAATWTFPGTYYG